MLTIGTLARRAHLSRSTLLYYSRIGLLRPRGRSRSNYRLYSTADEERLAQICTYRQAGLSLREIKELLDGRGKTVRILERRLEQLNGEIARYRDQQRVVLGLLRNRARFHKTRTLDKKRWVELLRATGLTDEDMQRWHVEFERMSPEAHQDFLESLGIPPDEVNDIRTWSRDARGDR